MAAVETSHRHKAGKGRMKRLAIMSILLFGALICLCLISNDARKDSSSSLFLYPTLSAQQKGKASFYSRKSTGKRTASGDLFHSDSLTCAHRSYPFGTLLKVTNPANGKQVVVKVTDRGPFVKGRIIDLSWGAAKALDILQKGVATVVVEEYDPTEVPYRPKFEFKLPQLDTEYHREVQSIIPIWQQLLNIDTTKIDRHIQEFRKKY